MRYRLEVRLTRADVGKRVVIRWRPGPADSKQATDVLGILEQADAGSFAVRTRDGKLVVIPAGRALAGKVVLPSPPADATPDRRRPQPGRHGHAAGYGCAEHEGLSAHDAAVALITEALAGRLAPAGGHASSAALVRVSATLGACRRSPWTP
jgi:hypothetical protein